MLADELSASGSETLALEVDVKKSSDAHMAVNKAVERFGRLDQLVCVAGGSTREKMCYFVDRQFRMIRIFERKAQVRMMG